MANMCHLFYASAAALGHTLFIFQYKHLFYSITKNNRADCTL